MYSAAKHAKGLAADAQKESSYDSAGRQSVQHAIQTVTQYMYKFGKEVGNGLIRVFQVLVLRISRPVFYAI